MMEHGKDLHQTLYCHRKGDNKERRGQTTSWWCYLYKTAAATHLSRTRSEVIPVKNVVKIQQDRRSGDFDDVVERFAGVVAHARVGIPETGQHGRDQLTRVGVAVSPQRDRRRSQPNQTTWKSGGKRIINNCDDPCIPPPSRYSSFVFLHFYFSFLFNCLFFFLSFFNPPPFLPIALLSFFHRPTFAFFDPYPFLPIKNSFMYLSESEGWQTWQNPGPGPAEDPPPCPTLGQHDTLGRKMKH